MINKNFISSVEKLYLPMNDIQYRVTTNDNIVVIVPPVEANTDYQEIQQWISEGNTVIDNGE
tara:strand:- start:217 stop:402 length:186 start_codon:yes stop_codon:yes gene_type:complete